MKPIFTLITALLLPLPTALHAADATASARLNVLFIACDDLRNDLGCYGDTLAKTPHLDRLARRGVLFDRAYCQQALCNPSRASVLTGLRPDTLRVWNLSTHFRDVHPDLVTLPQHFMQHGYHAASIGKIFHNWGHALRGDPASWSVPQRMHFASHYADTPLTDGQRDWPPPLGPRQRLECLDVPDDAYFDGQVASAAVRTLGELAESPAPFFLAVGFWKPHLPFNAPKRWWDLYDPGSIPLAKHREWPEATPREAWHNGRELPESEPGAPVPDDQARQLRHGYLAAVSYLDAQIGRVLEALEQLRLTDQTVVVVWSDHGFHLGERGLWCKTSNFELDARVPLIFAGPGIVQGGTARGLVELIDIYPTLVELGGLPSPDSPLRLEGRSLVPILRDPSQPGKPAAITQHPRPPYYGKGQPELMGISARTENWRVTQWRDWATGAVMASELYDHRTDPDEVVNLADNPAYAQILAQQQRLLPPHRRGADGETSHH